MVDEHTKGLKSNLVGSSNEAVVSIEGQTTKALVDTGSCVSTVSEEFYKRQLPHLKLHPISGILEIECADGKSLPYLGFVEADLRVVGIPLDHVQHCLLLVVPESKYSEKVPILIGTNILTELQVGIRRTVFTKVKLVHPMVLSIQMYDNSGEDTKEEQKQIGDCKISRKLDSVD